MEQMNTLLAGTDTAAVVECDSIISNSDAVMRRGECHNKVLCSFVYTYLIELSVGYR